MSSSGNVLVHNHNNMLKKIELKNKECYQCFFSPHHSLSSCLSLSLFLSLALFSIILLFLLSPFLFLFSKAKTHTCFQIKCRGLISALSRYKATEFPINSNLINLTTSIQRQNSFKLAPCFSSNLRNYVYSTKQNLGFLK